MIQIEAEAFAIRVILVEREAAALAEASILENNMIGCNKSRNLLRYWLLAEEQREKERERERERESYCRCHIPSRRPGADPNGRSS